MLPLTRDFRIPEVKIVGLPDRISVAEKAAVTAGLTATVATLLKNQNLEKIRLAITAGDTSAPPLSSTFSDAPRNLLVPQAPHVPASGLILPEQTKRKLDAAIHRIQRTDHLYEQWGLKQIAQPSNLLNFYGVPGTGKTLAAHWLADRLEKPVLIVRPSNIDDSLHGAGAKNMRAVFEQASATGSVLVFDEADSILSSRIAGVTQSADLANNAVRSEALMNLNAFKGIVVLTTNFIGNLDNAIKDRVRSIEFPVPDYKARLELWKAHLPGPLPLAPCVNLSELAESTHGLVGRNIRDAILEAAVLADLDHCEQVHLRHFNEALCVSGKHL